MSSPLVDLTSLPGSENRVDLDLDQGPPAPLNLEPFGPNPWAGGGASPVNTVSTGTRRNLGGPPATLWGTLLLLAIIFL